MSFAFKELSFLLRDLGLFLSLEMVGVFLLGEFFFFRERVDIVPFLETVEFLSYGGSFFFRSY